ncbi:MAG: hypothetical protein R3E03_00075 [Novosphingobium sp.]
MRLIDMTRAFCLGFGQGPGAEPYGITKIETTDGRVLYERKQASNAMLVPAYVAAGITDMLQSAVSIGTGGRGADRVRWRADRHHSTSNKDGWFLGFSSGITTGVWMGRDDDKPVLGCRRHRPRRGPLPPTWAGGHGPPVEQFDTQVTLPAWQLEPDDEANLGTNPEDYYYVDEQGNLIDPARKGQEPQPDPQEADQAAPPPAASEDFLDQATGRRSDPQAKPGRPG